MTDRYFALTVTLAHDIRADDAQGIMDAIARIKGVLTVDPHISDVVTHVAMERARAELGEKLWVVLHPNPEQRR